MFTVLFIALFTVNYSVYFVVYSFFDVFTERVRNKSMEKKTQDPAGIGTQDLLNTSQTHALTNIVFTLLFIGLFIYCDLLSTSICV